MKRLVLFVVLAGLFLFSDVAAAGCWAEFSEYVTNQNHPGENRLLIEFDADCDIDSTPALVKVFLNTQLVSSIVPERQRLTNNQHASLWPKFFMTTGDVEILEKLSFPSNLEIKFFSKGRQIIDVVDYEVVTYDAIIGPMAYDCGAITVWYDITPMYRFNFQTVPWVDIDIGGILQKTATPECDGGFCKLTVNFTASEYEQIKGKYLKTYYAFPRGTAKFSYDQYSSCKPHEGN